LHRRKSDDRASVYQFLTLLIRQRLVIVTATVVEMRQQEKLTSVKIG
jgi:hypothetical protein